MVENAIARTHTRMDGDFVRLAVVLPQGGVESVDIVDEKGTLLMRLNLFNHGLEVGQSIDVIFDPANTSAYMIQSWNGGERTLRDIARGSLVSISRAPSV